MGINNLIVCVFGYYNYCLTSIWCIKCLSQSICFFFSLEIFVVVLFLSMLINPPLIFSRLKNSFWQLDTIMLFWIFISVQIPEENKRHICSWPLVEAAFPYPSKTIAVFQLNDSEHLYLKSFISFSQQVVL